LATDALSEGFNLHRAGVVINYDIPYNPTRVIQRVGRINRINKKMFDKLYIYNSFPTLIGEEEIKVKSISTLKIKLINAVVGSDTKTLTNDEELVSYFKDEYKKAEKNNEKISWDTQYREKYELASKESDLMEKIQALPRRSRVKREFNKESTTVVFGKKGENSIFSLSQDEGEPQIISTEKALEYFKAAQDELGTEVDADFTHIFQVTKDKLFEKHELPNLQGRRLSAINVLKVIADELPNAKDYCDDAIHIIQNLDDISEGSLKDIAQLSMRDISQAYNDLQEVLPNSYIRNILNKAERSENEQELILFAEQLL